MKYRIKTVLAGAVLTSSSMTNCLSGTGQAVENKISDNNTVIKRPNIVFIMTDQHNAQYLACLGREGLKTPNFDALAQQSAIFTSAYSASPVSGPSRAAMFTGQYPLRNGINTNWIPLKDESALLTNLLSKAGYYNAMIGKLHLSPVSSSHGFQFRRLCDSPNDTYDKEEVVFNDYLPWASGGMGISQDKLVELADRSEKCPVMDLSFWLGKSWTDDTHQITTWTGNEAVSFLRNYKNTQPFFLHISFFGPHHPYSTCEPWDKLYDPAKVSLPPTLGLVQPGSEPGIRPNFTETEWREIIARYEGNISAIDLQIGRIIAALREQGLWENTLIVFTSDHGDHMGDFSQLGKGTMLESSVRVPFFIKPPGTTPAKKTYSEVISLIDLYSTFLDYAGIKDSEATANSRSIQRILTGDQTWENQVFSSLCSPDGRNGQIMFIKDQNKCVGFLKDGIMKVELYDRTEKIPDLHNLAGDPAYSSILEEMRNALQIWMNSFRKN